MEKNLRETIKELIRKHLLSKKGKVFGQCLTAVGWVGGTLPELYEKDGMVDISMADVADGGFVVGAALMGSRPIYVIRYQGFNWYNSPMIVNYAAKSKEIWKTSCPVFVRGIAMEGSIGPVAGSSHHSMYYRMPGIKIVSPMTPKEYIKIYDSYLKDDDVYYVSEHRGSYENKREFKNDVSGNKDIVIVAISITRFNAEVAKKELNKKGIKVGIIHLLWLKPLKISSEGLNAIKNSKFGALVLDDDYVDGIAKNIANDISLKTNRIVHTLGLKNKSAGFSKKTDNLPPSSNNIIKKIKKMVRRDV